MVGGTPTRVLQRLTERVESPSIDAMSLRVKNRSITSEFTAEFLAVLLPDLSRCREDDKMRQELNRLWAARAHYNARALRKGPGRDRSMRFRQAAVAHFCRAGPVSGRPQ